MPARGKENSKYQGQKWIRNERRLAIYLRDGMACVYCGQGIEEGIRLTLDHLTPHSTSDTPDNTNENLVTACVSCNSSRGNRPLADFCAAVAGYLNHGITGSEILAHITATVARAVDMTEAKSIIARRGGFSLALAALRQQQE